MTMRRRSIQTQIFFSMVELIFGIFLVLAVGFNTFVRLYIRQSALTQINQAIYSIQNRPEMVLSPRAYIEEMNLLLISPSEKLGTVSRIFLMDSSYSVVVNSNIGNIDKESMIAADLNDKGYFSNPGSAVYISDRFYVWGKKLHSLQTGESLYMVVYLDTSGIYNFTSLINVFLFILMGMALFIAAFMAIIISMHISRPIRNLSQFAKRIGQGEFKRLNRQYKTSEIHELLTNMNQTAQQLETFDSDQKAFFQNVSHELRTPLMSIKCYAEGVEYGVMEPVESSKIILHETDVLSNMIEDLLYISRVDSLTNSFTVTECDLRELLSGCVQRQRIMGEKRNIKFSYDFDDHPVLCNCSEKHMDRALTNLISNAIRYAESQIVLTCHTQGEYGIMSVKDDGSGVAESDLGHIFERFYKGKGGKHGIGLAITKSVVEQHKGNISVNTSSEGAEFSITLKLSPAK